MDTPTISVLMPVYNAEKYVREAIDSILKQSYTDFELIAIDDGSTDRSLEILKSYGDPRIRIMSNERNSGIIFTLNRGMKEAQGKYIARMDADDVSHPERFAKQVRFLDDHPDICLVGTWMNMVDGKGRILLTQTYPCESDVIQKALLSRSCFSHPTVMFKRDPVLLLGGYRGEAVHVEDYDLWLRLSEVCMLANIPEVLLDYRVHEDQICSSKIKTQFEMAQKCRRMAIERWRASWSTVDDSLYKPLSLWQSLKGEERSLGSVYLFWAELYRTMNYSKNARGLAFNAVLKSPLSIKAQRLFALSIAESFFTRNQLKAMRWYKHKLKLMIKS